MQTTKPSFKNSAQIFFKLSLFTMVIVAAIACSAEKEKKVRGASCKTDEDCISKWICEEEFCVRGKRSEQELAKKAALEDKKQQEAKEEIRKRKESTKPGEGKMYVKLCPFFRNTDIAVGTVYAVNQTSKQKYMLQMHLETPKNIEQSEFTFFSLPLGKYDVYLEYGIESQGRFDTSKMKCDPKNKGVCKDGYIREIEVVLPENEKQVKERECDWIAQ